MDSIAPAVGPQTVIIPLMNGMGHIEKLSARFGKEKVFGGVAGISATLSPAGEILHLVEIHSLTFGEQPGETHARRAEIIKTLSDANFVAEFSDNVMQDMWEKWVFIATAAGSTCLMRASIGDIVAAGASDLLEALFNECSAVAEQHNYKPRDAYVQRTRGMLMSAGSPLMASMLRDIERGAQTEGDHLLGDMLARANPALPTHSILRAAYAHVKSYEARRAREHKA
jgi:2-dehydropantoate 2-reductase